ncbi:MAG: hypothetical protein FWB72_06850 [Firmicutes bacterium]|nr:hypothetical protein [Bacillota bacterium]
MKNLKKCLINEMNQNINREKTIQTALRLALILISAITLLLTYIVSRIAAFGYREIPNDPTFADIQRATNLSETLAYMFFNSAFFIFAIFAIFTLINSLLPTVNSTEDNKAKATRKQTINIKFIIHGAIITLLSFNASRFISRQDRIREAQYEYGDWYNLTRNPYFSEIFSTMFSTPHFVFFTIGIGTLLTSFCIFTYSNKAKSEHKALVKEIIQEADTKAISKKQNIDIEPKAQIQQPNETYPIQIMINCTRCGARQPNTNPQCYNCGHK